VSVETVFLDRDGTINRKAAEGDYVKSWAEFEFLPGAVEALALLRSHGLRLIVVTNQRGIARGLMTEDDLNDIHARMRAELARRDADVDAIHFCPHEAGECDCRKPGTGMFEAARRDDPAIDFARSVMVGDSDSDTVAAAAIGARGIRIGGEVANLRAAAELITHGAVAG
jgi:histidinol-phosphate phosphatase family protein